MLDKVVIFVAGAALGSFVTWQYAKTKYEKIANEEEVECFEEDIEKVKDEDVDEYYSKVMSAYGEYPNRYTTLEEMNEYHNYANIYRKEEKETDINMEKPYVISPDDFDEMGYETLSFTLYDDGVLTDDQDNIIEDEDKEDLIGDALDHFGEYEDDSVFVRNDDRKLDIEILKDTRTYDESH